MLTNMLRSSTTMIGSKSLVMKLLRNKQPENVLIILKNISMTKVWAQRCSCTFKEVDNYPEALEGQDMIYTRDKCAIIYSLVLFKL